MGAIAKFLKVLASEASPWQIAFAIMFGMIMGLTPVFRLHNLIILFVVLFFRINLASFLVAFTLFSGLAYLFDPLMVGVGESLLTAAGWQATWQGLYNTGIGRLSMFNHTLTLGSLVVSLVLAPVVLFLSKVLVVQYRAKVLERINKLQVVRVLKASTLFQKISGIGG